MLLADLMVATLAVLLNLHGGQAFLLVHNLILHAVLLLVLKAIELLLLFVLLLDNLGLLSFLAPRLEDGVLDLAFLISALLVERVIVMGLHALMLILHLVVVDFLNTEGTAALVIHAAKDICLDNHGFVTLTFWMRSSLRFLSVRISLVRFFVSSIFFQVFCSSCLSKAIRLANNWASLSMLHALIKD